MLATAIALSLEGAPLEMEQAAPDSIIMATAGEMNIQIMFLSEVLKRLHAR